LTDATVEGCASSVLVLDEGGRRVRLAVGPGLPPDFIQPIEGELLDRDAGACGLGATLKAQVIVDDVASDRRWDPDGWPAAALAHGLRSSWSSPILSGTGELFGMFAINRVETGRPTAFHQGLIEQFTHVASIAIERKRAEEDLDTARSELARMARVTSLGALTASIAHEVNQPLSGIITNASTCLRMLAADPPNVTGAIETARRTIRDGNRASDVITRLRALFGKRGATMEAIDLSEAAREVVALSSSDLQRSRVILRTEFADDLPSVMGDRVQLQQVILNLLLNASDAMSEVEDRARVLVIVSARDEADRVRLTVRDCGVGFAPGAAERLFEPFYTTKTGGMGIGLSISRSIIESHGGRLWAEPNDGPGASFSFSVPRLPEGMTDADSRAPGAPATADAGQAERAL
jgi:signal transduction histidine kinase